MFFAGLERPAGGRLQVLRGHAASTATTWSPRSAPSSSSIGILRRARQRRPQLAQRAARPRPRPMGRGDARVVRALAAAAAQLRRGPRRAQPRAAARHPRVDPAPAASPSRRPRRSSGSPSPASEPAPEPEAQPAPDGRIGLRRRRYRPGSLKSMSAVAASWRCGGARPLSPPRHRHHRRHLRPDPDRRDRPRQRLRPRLRRRRQRHPRLAAVRGRRAPGRLGRVGGRVQPPRRRDRGHGADRASSPGAPSGACARTGCWSGARSAAIGLVLAQAALGGLTVENGLEDELVAAHLGARDAAPRACSSSSAAAPSRPAPPAARRPCAGCGPLALVTCGPRAGDDRRRRLRRRHRVPRRRRTSRSSARTRPAGPGWSTDQFPGCNGQGPLSFGQSRLADIQLAHRAVHVPDGDLGDRDGRAGAAPPGAQPRLLDRAAGPRRPDRARRDQRLGRQARRADHRPPGAGHDPVGDRRLRDRDPDAGLRRRPPSGVARAARRRGAAPA